MCVLAATPHPTPALSADSVIGKLVDIGYHKLFMSVDDAADTRITVVFESGGGGTSGDWEKVRAMLPANVRTIAYDRAGSGKSEAGPIPRTMAQEVFELHALLNAAKIKGPLILVGQSIGGLLVRLYTQQYGEQVAGVVLVDPTHESSVLGSMRYGGWVRLRDKATGKVIPEPQLRQKISLHYDSTTDYMAEEFQQIYLRGRDNPRSLGDRPLVILGAGKRRQPPGTPDVQWQNLRTERDQQIRDLTMLSSNATFLLDPESGHNIHHDNPAVLARAIETVISRILPRGK